MSIVMHPLTASSGSPAYTANDYRHVVNPFMFPSDGTPFDCVSGVRDGADSPLCSIDGLTVSVSPHCGVVSPWPNGGAYTYAIVEAETVTVPDSAGSYKIAVVVEDPSVSHGSMPRGQVKVFPASTQDSVIPGLVIAEVSSGSVSDVAPILRTNTVLEVSSAGVLDTIPAVEGQEALVTSDGSRYVRSGGRWVNSVEVEQENIGGGTVVFIYSQSSCTVIVNGVSTGVGSWDSVQCVTKVKNNYRPKYEIGVSLLTENGGSSTGFLVVSTDGVVSVRNMGGPGSASKRRGSACWGVGKQF